MKKIKIEEIFRLQKEGLNNLQIAEKTKISKKTVGEYLKKAGLNYTSLKKEKVSVNCTNCGKETYNKKFCSRSCSAKVTNTFKIKSGKFRKKDIDSKYLEFKGSDRLIKIANDKLLNINFDDIISIERKRKRIILEQNNKCFNCKLDSWFDKPLSLELEHKDGNNKNNCRDNLVCLCPNCHSLTDTWRGRNRRDLLVKKIKLTVEDFKEAYLKEGNVRQCLLSLGLVAKGANYNRVYKALESFDINIRK